MLVLWPGGVTIINGGSEHSQSQGLVEQGNKTIQLMINAQEQEMKICEWSKWLPEIQRKLHLIFIIPADKINLESIGNSALKRIV